MTHASLAEIAQSALSYGQTVEATYDIAASVLARGVPGDFVECGVYAGAQCAAMACALLDGGSHVFSRRVHLYDSFAGLPAATPTDEEIWAHHGPKTGEAACSIFDVQRNMNRWGIPAELLKYHAGWFEQSLPGVDRTDFPNGIALLRLDADLYSSTKLCMEYLYPLMSDGGWVIVDDWNLSGTRKAVQESVIPAPIYWRIPTK